MRCVFVYEDRKVGTKDVERALVEAGFYSEVKKVPLSAVTFEQAHEIRYKQLDYRRIGPMLDEFTTVFAPAGWSLRYVRVPFEQSELEYRVTGGEPQDVIRHCRMVAKKLRGEDGLCRDGVELDERLKMRGSDGRTVKRELVQLYAVKGS